MSRRDNQQEAEGPADEERQPDKPSYFQKLGNRAKHIGSLGQTLVKEPKAFPKKTVHTVRPWFRKVWKARGGGLYACGFVVTFVYLEIATIVDEVLSSDGVVDFFTAQLFEFVFRFFGESFQNMIQAFIWPVPIVTYSPPWGVAILVAMYLVFTYLIKAPLEKWLFHDED
ncbi:MAG: hypothetical protein ACE5KS_03510 [Woeseiaceae bacterium]